MFFFLILISILTYKLFRFYHYLNLLVGLVDSFFLICYIYYGYTIFQVLTAKTRDWSSFLTFIILKTSEILKILTIELKIKRISRTQNILIKYWKNIKCKIYKKFKTARISRIPYRCLCAFHSIYCLGLKGTIFSFPDECGWRREV